MRWKSLSVAEVVAGCLRAHPGVGIGIGIGTGVAGTGLPRGEWWSRMAGYLAVFGVYVATMC